MHGYHQLSWQGEDLIIRERTVCLDASNTVHVCPGMVAGRAAPVHTAEKHGRERYQQAVNPAGGVRAHAQRVVCLPVFSTFNWLGQRPMYDANNTLRINHDNTNALGRLENG